MPSRGLFGVLTQDVPTKALALATAVLLWIGVTLLGSRTMTVPDVPVSVVNLPSDLGIGSELPTVDIRLRVPRAVTDVSDPARLVRAFVDLAGSGLGERTALVTVSPTDPRMDVLAITPAAVRVALDPIVERTIPVRVVPTGTPAEGTRIGEVKATPDTVRVRAALGLMDRTAAIDVPVSVAGLTSSFDGEVPLGVPAGVKVTPDRVRASVAIEQAERTKTVGIRVITKGSPAAGYWVRTVTTDPSTVTIRGAREVLDSLVSADTAPVEVSQAREVIEVGVRLALPEGVTLVGGDAVVKTRVEIAPLAGTKEVSASVSVTDVPDGLRVASIAPPTLRVTVRGEGEAFDRLRDEDVRIVVSVGGREPGTVIMRPSSEDVRAPSGVRAVSIEPKDIAVTLESS